MPKSEKAVLASADDFAPVRKLRDYFGFSSLSNWGQMAKQRSGGMTY